MVTYPRESRAWKVGLSPSRAAQIVGIACRVEDLPKCVDAFRRGLLSVDQLAPIAKRAPWWTDAEICELARVMTVRQIRRVVNQYPVPDDARANPYTGTSCSGGSPPAGGG